MEKRIILEKRGRPDDQITELNLDNCRSTLIDGLTDSFSALETLSLINVGLVSLKNFPKLPSLRKLELSDNRISNGLSHLTGSTKLTHLNLSGNRIKDFNELQSLKELHNLEVLDLFNNEVTLIDNYRTKIFELIPSLAYLDEFDKNDAEAPDDEPTDEEPDDEEDDRNPAQFSINGIEIDLDELDRLEERVREKRAQQEQLTAAVNGLGTDLGQLALGNGSTESDTPPKDDLDELYEEIQRKQQQRQQQPEANESNVVPQLVTGELQQQQQQQQVQGTSLLSLVLTFASLLAFVNQICFRGNRQRQEDGSGNSDVSLAYLYNEDIEDDQEDWHSGESGDDSLDDELSSEGEADKDGDEDDDEEQEATGGESAKEPEARGQKRKFEGGTDSSDG